MIKEIQRYFCQRSSGLLRLLLWAAILASVLVQGACNKRSGVILDPDSDTDCISDEKYFQTYVWNPIIKAKGCFGCHKENGVANDGPAGTYNVNWGLSEDLTTNFATLKSIALNETIVPGKSALLYKPTLPAGTNKPTQHVGGTIFAENSEEFLTMQEFYNRSKTPSTCVAIEKNSDVPQGVVLSSYIETLRKASLSLLGRVPTRTEEDLVYEKGFAGLNSALDSYMNDENFYARLREVFNDLLLTDKYLFWDILDLNDYPQARWYEQLSLPPNSLNALRNITRMSIARAPIELMIYTVQKNLPFHHIVSAPYTMVNPFSARSYGVKAGLMFRNSDVKNSNDYYKDFTAYEKNFYPKFEPATLTFRGVELPHAGVLTDRSFLLRYPTTDTNVNRHRAHNIYKIFLNFDVTRELKLPDVDLSNLPDVNPTLTNPACTSCHVILDPIAGTFKNYNSANYQVRDWFDKIANNSPNFFRKMLAPGMSEAKTMPAEYHNNSLQWLGKEIAQDKRFAYSMVKHTLKALTGATDIEPGQKGYLYLQKVIEQNAEEWKKAHYNFKILIKNIVSGPYFRAKNVLDLVAVDEKEIFDIGIGRMLTPEQLSRKITSILGLSYSENPYDPESIPFLLNRYRLLYGGIDSDVNTVRVSTPNAIMANIQMRMANSMACRVSAKDFGILDKNKRRLFVHVEKEFIPFSQAQAATISDDVFNGDCAAQILSGSCSTTGHKIYHGSNDTTFSSIERSDAVNQIKRNIQYLHKIILGEALPLFDQEIHNTYKLWRATYAEYAKANSKTLDAQCRNYQQGDINIIADDNYTIRAWQAVLAYLMADYRFVFE